MDFTEYFKTDNDTYWFQSIDVLVDNNKLGLCYPTNGMTHAEKSNALVRGSVYLGVILALFTKNYVYLYIPILMMLFTYLMYYLKTQEETAEANKKNLANIKNRNAVDDEHKNNVMDSHLNMSPLNRQDAEGESFRNSNYMRVNDGLDHNSIKNKKDQSNQEWMSRKCLESTVDNPFMNPNPFSSRRIGPNCSPLSQESKTKIRNNFDKRTFKDASDIFDHSNSNRQFYTVPGNTFPNNRDTFMKWCYSRPKTCKEGNGAQCVANQYYNLRNTHTHGSHPKAAE
jgi:hypothetical protein